MGGIMRRGDRQIKLIRNVVMGKKKSRKNGSEKFSQPLERGDFVDTGK